MPVVARIEVPPPEPFVEGEEGAEARGAGYRFIAPRTATEPLVMEAADGSAFLWTPTELCYRDEHGNIDFIAGSAPVQLEVRGREARYRRTFPASDEVHIAQPEGRKYWLILHERPRDPASYLQGEIWFGVSGMVGGVPLPPGIHHTIQSFPFDLKPPFAADLMDAQTDCWYEVVDLGDGGQQLFIWCRADWLLHPERVFPVKVDPPVIVVSSSAALSYPNQRKLERTSHGTLWAVVRDTSSLILLYSKDKGEKWNQAVSTGADITPYSEVAIRIDEDDFMHLVGRSGNALYYLRGTPNESGTGFTWHTPLLIAQDSWTTDYRPSIAVHREGTGWVAHLVYNLWKAGSSSCYVAYVPISIAQDGTPTVGTRIFLADVSSVADDAPAPSIEVDSSKHLHAAYSLPGGVTGVTYYRKAIYTGGLWSWQTPVRVSAYRAWGTALAPLCVDSQGRAYISLQEYGGLSGLRVITVAADGSVTDWSFLPLTGGVTAVSQTIDSEDNLYVAYQLVNSSTYLQRRVAASGEWENPIEISTAYPTFPNLRRNDAGSSIDLLYMTGSVSPYSVNSYHIYLNQPPQQPTNLDRTPFDATEDAPFRWRHNDPDPTDGQAAYHLQIRLAGADTDLVDTGEVQSPVSQHLLPGGTLENGKTYQWRVRTADQSGEWSPWSDYAVFQTGPKPVATILYPTEGTTVSTAEVTVEWSVGSQSSATVRLYDEAGQTVFQEHEVTTPSARARTITGLQNNTSYQVSVQPVSTIGVTGDEVFSGPFSVQYTPPPKPTATAAGQAGFIRVAITNPPPAEGEPEVTHNDLYRREPGGAWVRIATGIEPDGTHDDYAVGSGVVYEYRVRAVGDNGTYTDSDPVQASVTYDEWRFSPVDGRPEIRFRFDSSVSWRPEEDVQVPRTQSRYRRTYRNPAFARVADIQARFKDGEDGLAVREQRERLLQYIEQGVVGWLRGPHGDCWRGVLLQSQVQPSPHFARETVACVFRETREAP